MRRKLVVLLLGSGGSGLLRERNGLANDEWEPPEGWRIVSIAMNGSSVVVMLESTEAPEGPYR